MAGETQGQSHFISNFSIGPDGKLYVHMGDGFDATTALDLNSFRGKILRLNLNGTAPADNPFYNAGNGITARDYIFAYGFRNPFGGCWRALDGKHYEVENGLSVNDRLAKVLPGVSYGWNGDDATMTTNAIYNWFYTVAPVNIAFVQPETFGGSLFPIGKQDHAFVTESGSTYATGPSEKKAIVEFELDPSGSLITGPTKMIEYNGTGQATAVGLAAGPDGLYFTDLYKDQGATSPIDPGANVLRLRYRGVASFSASAVAGTAPFTVTFSDLSSVPAASAWFWDFGDGSTSTSSNPSHTYTTDGEYDVKLTVTGANGAVFAEKSAYITVGPFIPGLIGDYHLGTTLSNLVLTRLDSNVDFDWGLGSPSTELPVDGYSIRWSGEVQAEFTETVRFFAATDDGARLWVNGVQLINQWQDQPLTETWGDIALTAGQWYSITMEYYENGGAARAYLSWQSPSLPKEIIPTSRLRSQTVVTSVEPTPAPAIARAILYRATPNPLRRGSKIAFAVPGTARATLRLYGVRGTLVATMFDGVATGQRRYEVPLPDRGLASGVYFAVLESAATRVSNKVIILR
jgi:PKD repeat protein